MVAGLEPFIDTIVVCTLTSLVVLSSGAWNRGPEAYFPSDAVITVVAAEKPGEWVLQAPTLPSKTAEAKRIAQISDGSGWRDGETVFMIVHAELDEDTGRDMHRMTGTVRGNAEDGFAVVWDPVELKQEPTLNTLPDGTPDHGIYGHYIAAALTGHAFDRVMPGLGKVLVTLACWLFAISTIIAWSYYGEQGIIYLVGQSGVLVYKLLYCLLIVLATYGFIRTDKQLDELTALGTGVMLFANIPIMLIFGYQAMAAYHRYIRRLDNGEMDPPHGAPKITDVVEGRDVE